MPGCLKFFRKKKKLPVYSYVQFVLPGSFQGAFIQASQVTGVVGVDLNAAGSFFGQQLRTVTVTITCFSGEVANLLACNGFGSNTWPPRYTGYINVLGVPRRIAVGYSGQGNYVALTS